MDPRRSVQDVLRCDLCETPVPPMYCDICHIHLCKACVGEHLFDFSKEHKIVPIKKKGSSTKCLNHSLKICELYCKQCDLPICVECASSIQHQGHIFVVMVKFLEKQKSVLLKDLRELKKSIYPNYKKIASYIRVQKACLMENSEKITTAINKHGEDLHREIDVIIKKLRSELDDMDHQHLAVVNKHEDEIKENISEITQTIADLEKMVNSDDVFLVSAYKSGIAKFRRLPPKLTVSLPDFTPHKINEEHIYKQFGSLTSCSIKLEKHSYTMDAQGDDSSPPKRDLLDEPRIIKEIKTEDEYSFNVSCLSDEDIWMRGNSNVLKLYNLQRGLVKSIPTKSWKWPEDIAVIISGDLVYTDENDRTVNILRNTQIQTVIGLTGWKPLGVCSTSSGELLVIVVSDDEQESKVVRYSGSTEKQCIQFNDNGQALYSSGSFTKYISENKNLDICVSDYGAHAVVVVNQTGKLRFTYDGNPSTTKKSLYPCGITTDSQSHILIADKDNNRIHILDQDGHLLCYIDNCGLSYPFGVCVDTRDNLFVSENYTSKLKKIQYYM